MVLLTALFFYGILPLVGAWRVRRRWMLFRQDVLAALGAPEVDFPLLQTGHVVPSGRHRLTGALEAFEGSDRLWIGNDRVSVAVSLVHTPVFFLDGSETTEDTADPPRRVEAPSLGALLEGTQFLVSGDLVADQAGQLHFASDPGSGSRLLVLAFEGDPTTVLRRALVAGRPVIDHWNSWTPVSVGLGITVLLILAWLQWGVLGGTGPLALALAFVPSTFFLPPGIAFFYGFGRFWARGRRLRAEADLRRTLPRSSREPWSKEFRTTALVWESVAHVFLTAGIVGNTLLLVWLVRLWVP